MYTQISSFKINKVIFKTEKFNKNDELKIVQITDFHDNKRINKAKMMKEIKELNPDIIVLTGDIIDFKTEDFTNTISLMKGLLKINSHVYFVEGNHELRNKKGQEFLSYIKKIGINIIDNDCKKVIINGKHINICGVEFLLEKTDFEKAVSNIENDKYTILLSHSPNRPLIYVDSRVDLILSGHTHGGQVRLPVVGAIVAPGQGLFPKYDKGVYPLGNTTLYIDSGLGCSVQPIRFLNKVQFSYIIVKGER
jgi:hypothetical protein